jgi:pyrimidine-specific ribonucleoside hydrolase
MGLRAREYFNVGIDELKIESFAGSLPPVSCLNDGLQVSTGGTLGHGTITLGQGEVIPKARFSFKNRIIELNIRDDIRQQIKKDVGSGVQTYGLDSTEYWEYIRELALRYWLELNRFDIFNIMEVSGT